MVNLVNLVDLVDLIWSIWSMFRPDWSKTGLMWSNFWPKLEGDMILEW